MMPFGSEYAYRAGWSRLQRLYITIFGIVDLPTRIRARAVRWALQSVNSEHILDVGTGTGVYALYATRNPLCHVLALDVDVARLEQINHVGHQLNRNGLSTMCGNETVLPSLPKSVFSVVLTIEVLQYFSDLPKTLRDLRDRLCQDGVLIAHVPIRKELWPYECTQFSDSQLESVFISAGFDSPVIHHTFNQVSLFLCKIFTRCVPMPFLLSMVYPILLLAINLTPRFTKSGHYRLVVARKSP